MTLPAVRTAPTPAPGALDQPDPPAAEGTYRVQYRQVADRWYVTTLFRVWLVLLLPYLVLRVLFINWGNVIGPVTMALELVVLSLTVANNLRIRKLYVPVHRPADLSRFTVDCLIPTHQEEVALIEPTIIAAQRVRGIRRVLLLGNFERDEVRQLCARLGVGYYPRGTNEYAKAGNLNNGLRHTDADFVMVLDADHLPRPELLERTMGYFDDSGIAFVQAPQTYYNTESFLYRRSHGHPAGWSEQQVFFQAQQLGMNGREAALFVGSTAVIRRSALDEVGGFATGTPTEDLHTALCLYARNWRAVFTPEPLAFGLEAGNMREFHNQRHRWAAGTLNLLFLSPDSPLRARGMSLGLRAEYLNHICASFFGLARLGFLLIPLVILVTLQNPVSISYDVFGPIFATWFLLSISLSHLLTRGASDLRYSDSYSFGSMLALTTALKGVFVRIRHFAASRKLVVRADSHRSKWGLWIITGLCAAATARGIQVVVTSGLSAMVFWAMFFTILQGTAVLAFLVYLTRFERRPLVAPHAELSGEEKYRFVMAAYAAGRIGLAPRLRDRPLRPVAAARPSALRPPRTAQPAGRLMA